MFVWRNYTHTMGGWREWGEDFPSLDAALTARYKFAAVWLTVEGKKLRIMTRKCKAS